MTKQEFHMGLKIFLSCGGPNPDEETLEVWYRMLQQVHAKDYEAAIMDICRNTKEMGSLNFVNAILEGSRVHRRQRESVETREEFLLPPKDLIPKEKLQQFLKEFKENLKTVPVVDENNY